MDGETPKTSAKGCGVPLITKDVDAYGTNYTKQEAPRRAPRIQMEAQVQSIPAAQVDDPAR